MKRNPLLNARLFIFALLVFIIALAGPTPGVKTQGSTSRNGLVRDWSSHHLIYTAGDPYKLFLAAQRDPRAFMRWLELTRAAAQQNYGLPPQSPAPRGPAPPRAPGLHADWAITLGTTGTRLSVFPAKFTFDINLAPTCAPGNPVGTAIPDYTVFPVNVVPSATQPNIVAFDNLYSGTSPNGLCNRTPSGSDTGVAATVFWSYAVNAVGGKADVSPVLSLDGTKVAFVENLDGSQPHFHVLAWKAGDGVNAANLQDVTKPKLLTSFVASAPVAGSGTATDLPFASNIVDAGDAVSSPFIDYNADTAYIGDDTGSLVRIKNVFCTTPGCRTTPVAPSIDTTWGSAGTVTVGAGSCSNNSNLTGPVEDLSTRNVYVGCSDGKLYGFNSVGTALANSPVTVGNGTTHGGIVDAPIVDSSNAVVYASSGTNGTNPVVVQTQIDLSGARTATLGNANAQDAHAPTFNDAYFSSNTSANWLLYACGYNSSGSTTSNLYGIAFNSSRQITTGTPAKTQNFIGNVVNCSPFTEFINGGTDQLYFGTSSGFIDLFHINSFPISPTPAAFSFQTGGTSGIIVDNVSGQNQASSVYFGELGGKHNAVKLTQSALK